jgi:putative acetyltransferase
MSDEICELKRLYVAPDAQGYGIGKALIQRAINDASARGYQLIRLDSLARLKSAARLYQHFGFERTEPYNHNPHEDVYYMQKHCHKFYI